MPAVCPFCKASVGADLLRYGGHCPKCMIAIPGEETPTDPGERAKVLAQLEEQAAKSRGRSVFVVAATVIGIMLGSGGAYVYQNQPPEVAPLPPIDDDIYIVPLSAHRDLVIKSDGSSSRVQTPKPTAAKAPSGSNRTGGLSERDLALNSPATGGTMAGSDAPPVEGTVLPIAGGGLENPLTALGPNIRQTSMEGIVLTDPTQINTMVKRVMSKGQGQLKQCYESRLKSNERLKGAWNVQFQIEAGGRASQVTVVPMNAPDGELESCIERNIEGWAFQKINESLVVQKVYRFGPGT